MMNSNDNNEQWNNMTMKKLIILMMINMKVMCKMIMINDNNDNDGMK